MITQDLQVKWEALDSKPKTNQYDLLLLSESSYAELFLARAPSTERSLVLRVQFLENISFKDLEGENISLIRDTVNNFIVIKLLNIHFKELFDYLIVSIANAITDLVVAEEYSKVFLRAFSRWLQFFVILPDSKHTRNVIQGIFGELIVLEVLLTQNMTPDVSHILRAWRGPYDTAQDFLLENKNIEVKTIQEGNFSVKIANEGQLDQADGKDLELAVVHLNSKTASGLTLSELINKVASICEQRLADIGIVYEALRQKNLVPANFSDYDDFIFHPAGVSFFDCGLENFPKLVGSNLPNSINRVRYSINTNELDEFEIRKIKYDDC